MSDEYKPFESGAMKGIALASGYVGLGVLLRRKLPNLNKPGSLIPTDWKTYAQIGLGVLGVNSLNKGLNLKPSPSITAVETTFVLQPMMMGFKMTTFRQLPFMGGYVGMLVGATTWAVNLFDRTVGQKYDIPKWMPQLLIWPASILGGAKLFPIVTRRTAEYGLLGQDLKKRAVAGNAFVSATGGVVCARGCCPSAVCAVEVGDTMGSLASGGFSDHVNGHTPSQLKC